MRETISLAALLLTSLLTVPAHADESTKEPSSFPAENETKLGVALLLGGYSYAASMGGAVYESNEGHDKALSRAFIPVVGPILAFDQLDSNSLVGARLAKDVECPGSDCLLALGAITVMGIEALLLIGSAVTQATGAFMVVHGVGRMASESTPVRPRVSLLPLAGRGSLGATLTIAGF